MTNTRNLVICPIGDRSKHRTWLAGPSAPDFDLFLVYYGDGDDDHERRGSARHYIRRKGLKWDHLHHVAEEHADTLRRYESIWCPDDDIACDTDSVNLLFEIFARYELQLAQPSIAKGDLHFRALAQHPGHLLRYSPFVETMCPVFTRDAFFKVADTFLVNRSGWGIDWLWSRRFALNDMAIIDKVGVHHTGRLGRGPYYARVASMGVDPYVEYHELARRYRFDGDLNRRMKLDRVPMYGVEDPDDARGLVRRAADFVKLKGLRRTSVFPRSLRAWVAIGRERCRRLL